MLENQGIPCASRRGHIAQSHRPANAIHRIGETGAPKNENPVNDVAMAA
jgi:hypothetical protein